MSATILLDTGPLVALLNRRDREHGWAVEVLSRLPPPALTCEAVISEACFLVRRLPGAADRVLELVESGAVRIAFDLQGELAPVRRLMRKYQDVPMSLAHAALVRMAELEADALVVTIDSDFKRYRIHGRRQIPLLSPDR